MKWWEWIVVACTVVNVGFIVVAFWVFSDVFKAVVLIKGEAEKQAPKAEPEKLGPPSPQGDLPVMPRWMDPASEKGLEFEAYMEILSEPGRFTEEDRKEADEYFQRLRSD